MTPEERLAELGHELPPPNTPVASYVGAVTVGNLVFVSGHGPYREGGYVYKGKLGREVDVPTGQAAAQLTILNLLASLKAEIGDVVTIVPNHACVVTNLHDEVAAHRGGRVVGLWPVAARGKLR